MLTLSSGKSGRRSRPETKTKPEKKKLILSLEVFIHSYSIAPHFSVTATSISASIVGLMLSSIQCLLDP